MLDSRLQRGAARNAGAPARSIAGPATGFRWEVDGGARSGGTGFHGAPSGWWGTPGAVFCRLSLSQSTKSSRITGQAPAPGVARQPCIDAAPREIAAPSTS